MKLNEFAQQLIFSKNLEDKLYYPSQIDLESKVTPLKEKFDPGRSDKIAFSKERAKFPSLKGIEKTDKRAQILHYFANHELLAIEIMALILLKFPQMPDGLKKSLLQSIKEEQQHFGFYCKRMKDWGVEFGDFSRNNFFWRLMQSLESIDKMISHLSLSFEQANLDFSLYYQSIFHQIGDIKTAEYLGQVYQDEIKHVKIGLYWFNQFRPNKKSLWIEYLQSLEFPMSPMRAKGKIFSIAARQEVGFDQEYIQNLKLFSASKGTCPNIYFFNPEAEYQMAKSIKKISQPPKIYQNLKTDLEFVILLLGNSNDIHIFDEKPNSNLLNQIKSLAVSLPEILEGPISKKLRQLTNRKIKSLQPWGETDLTDKLALEYFQSANKSVDRAKLYSKAYSKELWDVFYRKMTSKYLANNKAFITTTKEKILKLERNKLYIAKKLISSSGRGNYKFTNSNDCLVLKQILKEFERKNPLLVEVWYDKILDYSLQFRINSNNKPDYIGLTRFLTDERGQYKGAILNDFFYGISEKHKKIILDEKQMDFYSINRSLMNYIAEAAAKEGYSSYIGVDGCIYRDVETEIKLRPLLECNFRMNFGGLTRLLQNKIHSKSKALFLILTKKDFRNFTNWSEILGEMEKYFPQKYDNFCLQSGVMAFSNLKRDANFVSFCFADVSIDCIIEKLNGIGLVRNYFRMLK